MSRKHLGVALALAVSLVGGSATIVVAQPISPGASSFLSVAQAPAKTVKTTTANLNLRKSASSTSASLILIPKNTALAISKTSGIWHQVTYKSKTGWVSGHYLKTAPATVVYNYTNAYTTVKSKASGSSSNVVSVHRRTKVQVLGTSGSWVKVNVSGKTGFVPSSVLAKANPDVAYRWVNGSQKAFASTSTSSKAIATLPHNTKVEWLRTSGSWQQVRTSSGIGWIPSKNLVNQAIKPPVAKPKVYNYTNAYTTVKSKASGSSSNVLTLHRQSKVEVLGTSGSWTKIGVSGKTGFVPSSVLSKTNPATVYRWANGAQRVFQSASTTSKAIVTLPHNTKVEWLQTSGAWQQVRTTAGIGWVPSTNLATSVVVDNYTNTYTDVRASASASSSVVASVHRRTKVQVLGTSGSWVKVNVSGKTGFVPSSVLAKANPDVAYRWVNGSQKAFASTSTSSKAIATLPHNTKVEWLRTSGSWQQVRTSSGIGWIPSKNLANQAIKPPVAKPKVYNYTNAYTTVKSKASGSSSNVLILHRQSKVEVLGTSGSWTKIGVSGKTGFVPSSVLSKTNPATVYRWANGAQRVFQSASTTSKAIVTLPHNTKVEWLQTSGAWQQVRTTAGIGWVPSTNLATQAIKPPVPNFKTAKWSTSAVNVRKGGGTGFDSLGVIPSGEKVMSAGSTAGWSNVKTSKGAGWVSDAYLSSVEEKPEVDDKPVAPKFRWTTANLNIRAGNSVTAKVIGVVPMGEKVTYLESSSGWARVVSSKGTGWMSESYLSMTEYKPGTGSKPDATEFRWTRGNSNLRSGNSATSKILGVVPAGEKVTYLESKNGWARVVSSVGTGWISESLLSKSAIAQLQPDTLAVMDAVRKYYQPFVTSIGGVRPGSVGHSAGKAADIMIKDYKNPKSVAVGDDMAQFLINNRKSLGISYLIWQDKIWLGPTKGWEEYSKSGKYGSQFAGNWNDTTLHMDHIHAETYGNSGTGAPLVK